MIWRSTIAALVLAASGLVVAQARPAQTTAAHRNAVINLLEQKKPVFGVYTPSARPRRRRGEPAPTTPPKSPAQLATEALGYHGADYLFNGSMEGGVDRAYGEVSDFLHAMLEAGAYKMPLAHPIILKTPKIAPDPAKAIDNISRELNLGATGIMFVGVESAAEVRAGLAAMRFKSNGGTRPDNVGDAPKVWGMSEQEYRQKADLWPLNPKGELINWTIVESKEGLAHVREIAAVKGIGVLWPGAGTLHGVFTTTDANGKRVFDQAGWEAAIQKVLAACKEFNVPCGYPANADDVEMRMKQGFSVFVMPWGDEGFKAVEIGKKAAGRETSK